MGRLPLPVTFGQGAANGGLGAIEALTVFEILAEGTASESFTCIIDLGMENHWLHGCACEDQAQLHQPDELLVLLPVVLLV